MSSDCTCTPLAYLEALMPIAQIFITTIMAVYLSKKISNATKEVRIAADPRRIYEDILQRITSKDTSAIEFETV